VLGATADIVGGTSTAVLLAAESPDGRVTTMILNNAALSLGMACGGALGGLALALGDYPIVGLVSLIWLLIAAALVWWSRPRGVPSPATPVMQETADARSSGGHAPTSRQTLPSGR
jgi:predicted MFS family arabinose efflux permease